jgi:hypothetical protein
VPLDEARGLQSRDNLAALLRNVDLMAGAVADRDAALDCYESQTTEGNDGSF